MSFAVATTKMRERCSASQVRKVPSTRRDTPLSPSPPESAFSISSTQSTQGASPSAACSDSRRFFSASPCHLVYSAPKSKRTRGTPNIPAAARAARLLPQPWTPNRSTPFGGSSSGALPSNAGLRLASQCRRFCIPPTSVNFAVAGSYDKLPRRLRRSYFALMTPGMSDRVSVPWSKMACRTRRSASDAVNPFKLSTSLASASGSRCTGLVGFPAVHSRATRVTIISRSLAEGMERRRRAARCSSSSGRVKSQLINTTVRATRS